MDTWKLRLHFWINVTRRNWPSALACTIIVPTLRNHFCLKQSNSLFICSLQLALFVLSLYRERLKSVHRSSAFHSEQATRQQVVPGQHNLFSCFITQGPPWSLCKREICGAATLLWSQTNDIVWSMLCSGIWRLVPLCKVADTYGGYAESI
jgi:hypothetical protein